MMTIKDFAGLCGCSAQTLRYYDKVGLLKPAEVDRWSGYRYYDRAQAIDFVKIKNLQSADFTIAEIKELLMRSDAEICAAFDRKIDEQRQKLDTILKIKQSYLTEKSNMEKIVHAMADFMIAKIRNGKCIREFGLDSADEAMVTMKIRDYLETKLANDEGSSPSITVDGETFRDADEIAEKLRALEIEPNSRIAFGSDDPQTDDHTVDPSHEVLYERHGWSNVSEFIDYIPAPQGKAEHVFHFHLTEDKLSELDIPSDMAFPLFMIGAMILRHDAQDVNMGCNVEESTDGQNHFIMTRSR